MPFMEWSTWALSPRGVLGNGVGLAQGERGMDEGPEPVGAVAQGREGSWQGWGDPVAGRQGRGEARAQGRHAVESVAPGPHCGAPRPAALTWQSWRPGVAGLGEHLPGEAWG